jgi:protein-L-isoaspartate(D-aspartate) O-methyltransferase
MNEVDPSAFPWAEQPWSTRDEPLPIGEGQTISQPFIVAWMTQALHLQPGERVLEIGTGSGFQTALLCELTQRPGEVAGQHVYTIERFDSLAHQALARLNELGYHPHAQIGDGALGWPAAAPFAAILVTAAPAYLPRPLWQQLAEAGRMVIPIGPTNDSQTLWLIRKVRGQPESRKLGDVRFVPLQSPILADPAQRLVWPPEKL